MMIIFQRDTGINIPVPFVRIQWHIISSVGVDRARSDEVFMEVIHEFQYVSFHGTRNTDIINQATREGDELSRQ